jgi:hypothetical protein
MSILNRTTDGLLSVFIVLRRTLLAYGELDSDRLIALAAPASVVGSSKQARQTLNRWTQFGVFVERDGLIKLAPPFETIPADDTAGLRRAMIRTVLSDHNNPSFSAMVTDGASTERPLATDFTRAVSWMLAQDVYAVEPSHPSVEALQSSQSVQPVPFVNDTRWQGFLEWAAFLGFSSRTPRLLFEPHFAVSTVLEEVFASDTTMDIGTFLGRLSGALPVLDGGRFRTHVDTTIMAPPYSLHAGTVSIALSAALLYLDKSGELRLETRSDAPAYYLLGSRARELMPISHVTRGGPE